MNKTTGSNTPGGRPGLLENPHSIEFGPTDSGEDQLLHLIDPFTRRARVSRSPPGESSRSSKTIPTTPQGNKPINAENCTAALLTEMKKMQAENEELRKKLSNIELLTSHLQNEVKELVKENKDLKKELKSKPQEKCREYLTDEEELLRETDWIIKEKERPSKKRKAVSSPVISPGKSPTKGKEKVTKNKVTPTQPDIKKERPPPPINIIGIASFAEVKTLLNSVSSKNYKIVAWNNDVWKIHTTDSDTYRALAKKLSETQIQWFTYEDKNNRPIKVMARGLHPTCDRQSIIEDLQQKGMHLLDAVNILKKREKNR